MFENEGVLAIIPARGGSKSIPKKNIKLLAGKPLIAYTIEEALKSKYIDRTIVSTDSREIAEIAKKYGAEVPFLRPKKYAGDKSSSLSVILHALRFFKNNGGYIPDLIVFLQPTTPLRRTEHIDMAIKKINGADAVVSVREVADHPYIMYYEKNKWLATYIRMKNKPQRRQDMPQLYVLNGAVYVVRRGYYDRVVNENSPIVPEQNVRAFVMDKSSSIDIDSPLDFEMIEFLLNKVL